MGRPQEPSTTEAAAAVWSWAPATEAGGPVLATLGYAAHGLDDELGAIVAVSPSTDGGYLVLDAGSWLDHARVLVPAGAVGAIDHEASTVEVALERVDVAGAPGFQESCDREAYRRASTAHYAERMALHAAG